MDEISSRDELICKLQHQLSIARNEVKNLRQQILNLKYTHKNDVDQIRNLLRNVKCRDCSGASRDDGEKRDGIEECNRREFSHFRSIGTVETWFQEKRGTPRQGTLCAESQGVLTLFPSVINNPRYALDGLEEYSHLWIIYRFHKTDSDRIRAKVSPPKLNGQRMGVFATRSPHRPCPIGLSVVKIDRIAENKIYFYGADMMSGTPVLDVKPYIPCYDNPTLLERQADREVEGGCSESESSLSSLNPAERCSEESSECRQAPDGEEDSIRIPVWLSNSMNGKLKVEFTKTGSSQLERINQSDQLKKAIVNVVEEDPRSVYLKQKLGDQFYTFSIKDVQVTCKFDDDNGTVVIHQVKEANRICECGIPQWQCSEHSQN